MLLKVQLQSPEFPVFQFYNTLALQTEWALGRVEVGVPRVVKSIGLGCKV